MCFYPPCCPAFIGLWADRLIWATTRTRANEQSKTKEKKHLRDYWWVGSSMNKDDVSGCLGQSLNGSATCFSVQNSNSGWEMRFCSADTHTCWGRPHTLNQLPHVLASLGVPLQNRAAANVSRSIGPVSRVWRAIPLRLPPPLSRLCLSVDGSRFFLPHSLHCLPPSPPPSPSVFLPSIITPLLFRKTLTAESYSWQFFL